MQHNQVFVQYVKLEVINCFKNLNQPFEVGKLF